MNNMSWSWFKKKKKSNMFAMIPANLIAVVNFYSPTSHSFANQFYFKLCLCVFSINLVMDALLAAALILYNIQTPFSNIPLIWSHTCPGQLTPGAVNSAFQCEQTGCISRPQSSSFFFFSCFKFLFIYLFLAAVGSSLLCAGFL